MTGRKGGDEKGGEAEEKTIGEGKGRRGKAEGQLRRVTDGKVGGEESDEADKRMVRE